MKKALFLLLAGGMLSAQTSDLLSNNWYISKMETSAGQTTNTPLIDGGVPISKFTSAGGTSYSFSSKYYNVSGFLVGIMPGTNNMIMTASGGCTLAWYNGSNAIPARNYDQKNCDYFVNASYGSVFTYQITTSGNLKTLVITSPSGNKMYYNNTSQLSTAENEIVKKEFSVYPNPVTDVLHLENVEKNLMLRIHDASGKLVYETKTADRKVKIDVQAFQAGSYILTVEGYKSLPFIRK